jgi:hypothetical protein
MGRVSRPVGAHVEGMGQVYSGSPILHVCVISAAVALVYWDVVILVMISMIVAVVLAKLSVVEFGSNWEAARLETMRRTVKMYIFTSSNISQARTMLRTRMNGGWIRFHADFTCPLYISSTGQPLHYNHGSSHIWLHRCRISIDQHTIVLQFMMDRPIDIQRQVIILRRTARRVSQRQGWHNSLARLSQPPYSQTRNFVSYYFAVDQLRNLVR